MVSSGNRDGVPARAAGMRTPAARVLRRRLARALAVSPMLAVAAAGTPPGTAGVPAEPPRAERGPPRTAARQWATIEPNAAYDGRFTFARIRYTVYSRSGWEFDYPAMERNLMSVTRELTSLRPHVRESNIHTFDDPELMKYPVAYLSEPGYWVPSDSEVAGLRAYLAKGGFLIVDDFMRGEWENFERQIRRVLPGCRIERLDVSHPIFDAFFRIASLDMPYPGRPQLRAEFLGIFEDNDPAKRLAVVINYNNDIGDYMEWSGEGWWPVNVTNDAYKLAVNYIVYGLTH